MHALAIIESQTGAAQAMEAVGAWLLLALIPVSALTLAVYFIISLPLRRQERARALIDLIESALAQGVPIERYIVSLAEAGEVSMGARFHLMAAYIARGHTLISALEKVPRLLPRQMVLILKAGEAIGDIGRVLPASRRLLADGTSQTRALINYQVIAAFLLNPLAVPILPITSVKSFPVLLEIAKGFGMKPAGLADFVPCHLPGLFAVQLLCSVLLFVGAGLLLAARPPRSALFLRIPWRRKRLQRDFSAMLALLLDAGLPEERAVILSAASTTNRHFVWRAAQVVEQLRAGVKLPQAIGLLDDTGEFRWRLANAAHAGRGFVGALKGWQDWLEAKAFQQEQGAAQVISTVMLVLNALVVALVAAAFIQGISRLVSMAIK